MVPPVLLESEWVKWIRYCALDIWLPSKESTMPAFWTNNPEVLPLAPPFYLSSFPPSLPGQPISMLPLHAFHYLPLSNCNTASWILPVRCKESCFHTDERLFEGICQTIHHLFIFNNTNLYVIIIRLKRYALGRLSGQLSATRFPLPH